ncbi:hypothetical protein CSB20_10650 [bacterium DOLZORAL124_64_63]|nr:MAG: hypothetical protein CSB20_10650 [bacterium DOLZORAL124_64_63]
MFSPSANQPAPFRPSITAWIIFALAVVLFLAHAQYYRPWVEDDTYISLQYARHLVQGQGLVFNPGEKVEGFSNPSWVLLGALAMVLKQDPLAFLQVVGMLCGLVVLWLSWRLATDLMDRPTAVTALAPLVLALTPMLPRHSVTGLETALFTAGLLAAVFGLGRGASGARLVWGLAGLVVLVTTRPEGMALALVPALWRWWAHGRQERGAVLAILTAGATAVALLAARWLYFGDWVPNTFHAKVSASPRGVFEGVLYTVDFLRDSGGGALVLFFLALLLFRDSRRLLSLLAVTVGLMVLVVLAAGGDWMHLYRFYVPIYPLLVAGATAGAGRLHGALVGHLHRPLLVAGVLGAGALMALLNTYKEEKETVRRVMPHVLAGHHLVDAYRETGLWLRENSAPEDRVAVSDIGMIGYAGERAVVDMFGLIDPHIARAAGRQHFKSDPAHVLARDPRFVVLVRDAAGGYLRVPDMAMAATPEFAARYALVRSFRVEYSDEWVDVYRRK